MLVLSVENFGEKVVAKSSTEVSQSSVGILFVEMPSDVASDL